MHDNGADCIRGISFALIEAPMLIVDTRERRGRGMSCLATYAALPVSVRTAVDLISIADRRWDLAAAVIGLAASLLVWLCKRAGRES